MGKRRVCRQGTSTRPPPASFARVGGKANSVTATGDGKQLKTKHVARGLEPHGRIEEDGTDRRRAAARTDQGGKAGRSEDRRNVKANELVARRVQREQTQTANRENSVDARQKTRRHPRNRGKIIRNRDQCKGGNSLRALIQKTARRHRRKGHLHRGRAIRRQRKARAARQVERREVEENCPLTSRIEVTDELKTRSHDLQTYAEQSLSNPRDERPPVAMRIRPRMQRNEQRRQPLVQ